jgi:pimeloyl-ACP methyl ester carboxylesterase
VTPAPHKRRRLDVPGARLHYEVQGTGPALMLIGHPLDSSGFAAIAPLLADDHTVVIYDPRGFGRSTIDDGERQDAEPDHRRDPGLRLTVEMHRRAWPHRLARLHISQPRRPRPRPTRPGHDRYFEELAAILAVEGPPDPQAIAELRRRYDTEQIDTLVAG